MSVRRVRAHPPMTGAYKEFQKHGSLTDAVYGQREATPEDHTRALAAVDSLDDLTCMEGCIFLLAYSDATLLPRLVSTIERLATADKGIRDNIALAMGALPGTAFRDYPQLAQFILSAARDPDLALNASILVERLAACGHREATQVYSELQNGADADARNNALIEFRKTRQAIDRASKVA